MVTCNEIRIGNLILFSPTWKSSPIEPRLVKVKRIYEKSCIVIDMGLDLELAYESASTQPIPITEDWLLRLGFSPTVKRPYVDKKAYGIVVDFIGYVFSGGYIFKHPPSESFIQVNQKPIESVHELQNLMYSILGREL